MTWLKRAAMLIAVITIAAVAAADQWNDRTKFKFDEPVMVPGTTLAPGTYTFKLQDSKSNRHIVQIWNEDETKLITTANTVPAKRMDVTGDAVLKLNPTEAGVPIAIKAWFYPGSRYGHQFIYPDEQARQIAQRTKTVVLSSDVPNSDMDAGRIYVYDANGQKGTWHRDDQLSQEWNAWYENGRTATARMAAPVNQDHPESTAPMVHSSPQGDKVAVGDLEDNPQRYIGKTISVTGEVDEVFGPRLFKIDEPNWADLDGEIMVYMPTNFAGVVRQDDRVTVTGTMKMAKSELQREMEWLEPTPDITAHFGEQPVLFASRIVGGDNDVVLSVNVTRADNPATDTSSANGKTTNSSGATNNTRVGTSGTAASPIADLTTIANGNDDLVGRRVNLGDVGVGCVGARNGFWIESGGASVLVRPVDSATAASGSTTPSVGQSVSIDGIVLEMPRRLRKKADAVNNANDQIYIYATSVK